MEFTLREIADAVGGEVRGDDRVRIKGVNSLADAREGDLSFFSDHRYEENLRKTKASAVIVSHVVDLYDGPQVVVANPGLAYAGAAGLFAPAIARFSGISDEATIGVSSRIGDNVSIYPHVYVGESVEIGNDVTLFPGVFLGDRVSIGQRTVIYPNVTVMHDCVIGKEVIIHAGSVIGSDGFGFVRDGATNVKIPQIGIVQIDDQVEIGANNCIDRAAIGKTWIKRGVKTDNLVQIGHNVVIGEDTIVVSQVGISGSVEIGREVLIGGQVGFSDHVKIGDKVMLAAGTGVMKSIPSGAVVSGRPAMPHRLWLKTSGLIRRLPELNDRLKGLEKRLKELETGDVAVHRKQGI